MNDISYGTIPAAAAIDLAIDPLILSILKMSLGNQKAFVRIAVQLTGIPETGMTNGFEYFRPFVCLQRDTIGSRKSS